MIKKISICLICLFACITSPQTGNAQGLSITITPPFFSMNVKPGDFWGSLIRVVNNNKEPISVSATPASFTPQEEGGYGTFLTKEQVRFTPDQIPSWLEVPDGLITIDPGQTAEIPFTIKVPQDASPGGHYGGILIGNKPGAGNSGSNIGVSTMVSSLLFVRVAGNILEEGRIKEFSVASRFAKTPQNEFLLRFENTGNVHLQPRGIIEIKNMWGKERGRIEVNQDTAFGNVLPSSTRRFNFKWNADDKFFDIGRYTATVTLSYGEDSKQNATATIIFYIIPLARLSITIGSILLFIFILVISIKWYVRRALKLSLQERGQSPETTAHHPPTAIWTAPVKEGILDLRKAASSTSKEEKVAIYARWRKPVITLGILLACAGIIIFILSQVSQNERKYQIEIKKTSLQTPFNALFNRCG